ncbi:putative Golgi reassembly stacking protein [Myxozyma melibiosi]|uniref:Golgi reassembly stacking protein n=1 Tax=Myxozyma melibiosi TaxID=54550 RepID=A0ABR1F260_9ASCO
MGNEQSMQGPRGGAVDSALLNSFGFHVLKILDGSLAAEAGFEPMFDFIVGINGHQIEESNPEPFVQEIQNCAGRSVRFAVFSYKGQQLRELSLSLPAISETTPKVELGMALQWAPLALSNLVFHVLDVQPASPAFMARLIPESDYIVGIEGFKLLSENALGEVLEANVDKDLTLRVYNADYDTVRLATIVPDRNWGGEGVLGCGIGFGFLHKIPAFNEQMPVPGETIFSADEEPEQESKDEDLFDPSAQIPQIGTAAPTTSTAPSTSAPSESHPEPQTSADPIPKTSTPPPTLSTSPQNLASSRVPPSPSEIVMPSYMRRKHHKPGAAAGQLDAYFDEQERISKEADTPAPTSSSSKASMPPPPPKDSEIRRKSASEEAQEENNESEDDVE